MPSEAVAVSTSSQPRTGAPGATPADEPATRRGNRPRRSLRAARSYLLLVALGVLAVWLVLVFGRSLTELNDATQRAAAVRSEAAALEARLEAGRRELELVQTDAFQRMQARAFGMGGEGERAFALEPGAPSPAAIAPLGAQGPVVGPSPLESWLRLLFGGS